MLLPICQPATVARRILLVPILLLVLQFAGCGSLSGRHNPAAGSISIGSGGGGSASSGSDGAPGGSSGSPPGNNVGNGTDGSAVPTTFFGMTGNSGLISRQPWPTVPIGTLRLWDSSVSWAEINTANGTYDFSKLDAWLDKAAANGIPDVLYTFGHTPAFASSNPSDLSCSLGPGQCDPPSDLNADGSGTDQYWISFVTAIATHVGGRIKYWELWNEPHNPLFWTGTAAQMVRMAKDARGILLAINPNAVVVSPSPGLRNVGQQWMASFLAAGGGQQVDIIAFHGYVNDGIPGVHPTASDLLVLLQDFKSTLAAFNESSKPLWDTEANWGRTSITGLADPDLQAAFLAQFEFLHVSSGVTRFYWYAWNNNDYGTLWRPDPANPSKSGTLLRTGIAYQQVTEWLTDAVPSGACAQQGTVWTCALSRPGGYQALAVWDTAQSCSVGVCTSSTFLLPQTYLHYRDLSGKVRPIDTSSVPIGVQPILLENQ